MTGAGSGATASDPDTTGSIAAYAFLSDCQSAALVSDTGSVDWWCVPRFDSPSVFGRLLDPDAGHWVIRPVAGFTAERQYAGNSLAVSSVFTTPGGAVAVIDALALEEGARGHDIGLFSPHVLLRRVVGISGTTTMQLELAPRPEYGRTEPHLSRVDGGIRAEGGPVRLTLRSSADLECVDEMVRSRFTVAAGEVVEFRLAYDPAYSTRPQHGGADASIDDTLAGWESWAALHTTYQGAHSDLVRRSALVLQGLTFSPSGAVVAAATTSLPEQVGGELNFDYRYAWLRDFSLTLRALWVAACPDEPARAFDWLARSTGHIRDELIQIMYGVEGERDLTERLLPHLSGFRGSTPVRVGNAAWDQKQLDVLGEVLDAAHLMSDHLDELSGPTQRLLVTLANRAVGSWAEADAGMWEARDAERHYTSSKVMCWVALDRAIQLAPRLGDGAQPERWAAARAEVRAAILDRAWSEKTQAYCGAFDSDELDASVLILPLVGFLPATDERMRATIEGIADRLGAGGLIRRWAEDPSGFLLCNFWLAECLALAGESDRARSWFDTAARHANDLGLLSEEVDPHTGELLGNFPQAFSHVGLINAAWRLDQARADQPHEQPEKE